MSLLSLQAKHLSIWFGLTLLVLCPFLADGQAPTTIFSQQQLTLKPTGNELLQLEQNATDIILEAPTQTDDDLEFALSADLKSIKVSARNRLTTGGAKKFKFKYKKGGETHESEEVTIAVQPNVATLELSYINPQIDSNKPIKVEPGQTLSFIEGQSFSFKLNLTKPGAATVETKAITLTSDSSVVSVSNKANLTAGAANVQETANIAVTIEGETSARRDLAFKIQAREAIEQITVQASNSLRIPEGSQASIVLKITGTQGNPFFLKQRKVEPIVEPKDHQSKVLLTPTDDGFIINAVYVPQPSIPLDITFISHEGKGGREIKSGKLSIELQQVTGYLTFSPPPLGFLLPGGSFTITAQAHDRLGVPLHGLPLDFAVEPESKSKWVNLAPEGNKLTVYWNEPEEELAAAGVRGSLSPLGETPKRPTQVTIKVTARKGQTNQINGLITIRMGEVAKFAPLKVKLNLMDERTAADLYGQVTSNEYHVLTVRLFNNLKDEETNQYTGASILTYSASIEVAVGLEKRFDKSNKSYFSNVIDKQLAQERARARSKSLRDALTNNQIPKPEVLNGARQTLSDLIKEQYNKRVQADKLRAEALKLKKRAQAQPKDRDQIKRANEELRKAREALDEARAAEEAVARQQLAIFRADQALAPLTPPVTEPNDPNTAIDDGLWRPVTNADLERATLPPPQSTEQAEDEELSLLEEAQELAAKALAGDGAQQSAPPPTSAAVRNGEEPPCIGAITYRPFTFEMMVNTVDRRDNRSKRGFAFKLLEGIGTGASFLTSIAIPASAASTMLDSNQYRLALGLDKYRNLLLPGIDRIFPSLKEQQRQNIVSQAMKELEEIPFGSDITRVLFVPKEPIQGLIRGHDARISQVCPYFFSVQVAIVKKGGIVQQGSITR